MGAIAMFCYTQAVTPTTLSFSLFLFFSCSLRIFSKLFFSLTFFFISSHWWFFLSSSCWPQHTLHWIFLPSQVILVEHLFLLFFNSYLFASGFLMWSCLDFMVIFLLVGGGGGGYGFYMVFFWASLAVSFGMGKIWKGKIWTIGKRERVALFCAIAVGFGLVVVVVFCAVAVGFGLVVVAMFCVVAAVVTVDCIIL